MLGRSAVEIGQGRLAAKEALAANFPETFLAILLVYFEFCEG